MEGGAQSDRFIYQDRAEGGDRIRDFDSGAGGDILDLGGLLDKLGYSGDDPRGDGVVRLQQQGGNTLVRIDADGDGSASTLVVLEGVVARSITDDNLVV